MRSARQNNGKITGQTDNISGEQVIYAYDALNRLASAGATSGTWGQSYSYDGFGNLQNQTVTAGTNNRQSTDCADANGNIYGSVSNGWSCGSISPSYSYDASNRIVSAAGVVQYGCAPGNKRVWKGITTSGNLSQDTITFWSVTGQKLGDYNVTGDPSVVYNYVPPTYPTPAVTAALGTANYYFGGKQIAKVQWQVPWSQTWPSNNTVTYVGSDRLGSFGKYYPWGQEKPSATANNTEKFTGYFRDAETGLDYADQRYHQPGAGRFVTPDPYRALGSAAADPGNTGSWNKYAYVQGDPVNFVDRPGLYREMPPDGPDPDPCYDPSSAECQEPGGGGGGGGGGNGGGGGGAPAAHITSANPTAAQVQAVNAGYQDAFTRINNPGCAELFNSLTPLLADMSPAEFATFSQNFAAQFLGGASYYIMALAPNTGALTSTDNTVFLNANGAYFNAAPAANGSVTGKPGRKTGTVTPSSVRRRPLSRPATLSLQGWKVRGQSACFLE